MPDTPDLVDLIASLDAEILRRQGTRDAIAAARLNRLVAMRDYLRDHGFPGEIFEKAKLSLVPLLFQEANYDDLDWSDQHADLAHLTTLFDLDCRVMNTGARRSELTAEQFGTYLKQSREIIDLLKAR